MWLLLVTGLLVLAGFLYDPLSPSAWFVSVGLGAGFVLFVGGTAIRWCCTWRRQRS